MKKGLTELVFVLDKSGSMKIRQTNADITDLKSSIEAALNAQAPVSIHDALIEATTSNVQDVIKRHITPDNLERIVKWYMKKMGADVVRIPAKNERNKENGADADVIAEFNDLRVIYYIQVKKHAKRYAAGSFETFVSVSLTHLQDAHAGTIRLLFDGLLLKKPVYDGGGVFSDLFGPVGISAAVESVELHLMPVVRRHMLKNGHITASGIAALMCRILPPSVE